MSKNKSPSNLPLFPSPIHKIPQMPEGYYSSGPNPNLRRFVEEHTKPYNPEHDGYHVPPFDQPITTTKATAIYNMHTYWSKKLHDAIQQYIRHYTQPGDLVLDPFCGSGGTALAALIEGRAAIAIDLSPAATFITKNYCTPVDVDELQRAFEELQAKVKPEMEGVPPHDRDKPENSMTMADWIRQCRRSGLFDFGRLLFEKGGNSFDGLSEKAQMEVEENYQVCVGRANKKDASKLRKVDSQQFDLGLK